MKLFNTRLDKNFLLRIMYTECSEKASFVKPAHSEREGVQTLSPRHEAATLEQSVRSGTVHPRYRMA